MEGIVGILLERYGRHPSRVKAPDRSVDVVLPAEICSRGREVSYMHGYEERMLVMSSFWLRLHEFGPWAMSCLQWSG